jgi:hypothetical protein
VWKRAGRLFRDNPSLHIGLGKRPNSLQGSDFYARTEDGAIRSAMGRIRLFLPLSAGILTGFSADSPEN